jgi:hypothetical protein
MREPQLLPEFNLELIADVRPIGPVLRGLVVTRLLQYQISCDLCEQCFIVEACELIQLGDLFFYELILECHVQLEL